MPRAVSLSINPRPCHSEPVTDVTGVGIRNLLAGNLRKSAGIMRFGNGLPRQCVPQGHLLRGAHWLAMTGFFDSLNRPRHSRGRFLLLLDDAEQALAVFQRGVLQLLRGDALPLRQLFRHQTDVG